MFSQYTESGPPLLTDPSDRIIGRFLLENTSSTVANTIRRCILTETRSVGFRADLTNDKDPGVRIRKNTSVIFNEMLAHRLTLIPVGVRNIDDFVPSNYEIVLNVKNDNPGLISDESMVHVKAGDFVVRQKQEDGSFADLGAPESGFMFPADPITKDTCLIVSLRPQWNTEQPAEEIDLTAYPVVGKGRDFMGFCPVSQCSFENTLDPNPVRQEQFFKEWLLSYKKIDLDTVAAAAPEAEGKRVTPEQIDGYRKEWSTMAIQRCFMINEKGDPNSFSFTVESVGVRPVKEIVAEGIQAVIDLLTPYTSAEVALEEIGITIHPADSRMTGYDLHFAGQEHTLGNLLQTFMTELFITQTVPDSTIHFVGYKVRHPLQRIMTLRIGLREGPTSEASIAELRKAVAMTASKAREHFEQLKTSWAALGSASGSGSGPGSASGSGPASRSSAPSAEEEAEA